MSKSILDIRTNLYYFNGLKARSSTIFEIKCKNKLDEKVNIENFDSHDTYVQFDTFATSIRSKNQNLSFPKISFEL